MVHQIANLIEAHYVLPEKGKSIAQHFLIDLEAGRFYNTQSLKQLDSVLTKSLREASQDFHLYTWNNYQLVQQLATEQEETNEPSNPENFFNSKKAFASNFGFEEVRILPENIGYLKLSQINISELSLPTLYATMQFVAHTDALIIDLRNNGGGGSTIGPVLESYFLEAETELLEFRERSGKTEVSRTVKWLLEKRYDRPLYLIINKGTASAAEAFAFALKNQGRCTIVGSPSSGGAYMNTYFPVNEHFIVAISTAAPFLPGTEISWEGKGVQPNYQTTDGEAMEKAVELILSVKND